MEPIASYREVRMEGKRTFHLFADRVIVQGHIVLKSSFEINLPLRTLNPEWSHYRIRSSVFQSGMWWVLGLPVSLGLYEAKVPGSFPPMLFFLGLMGIFMMLVTLRKIEYAAFQNASGAAVLMMARSGPDAKKFDDFVSQVATQIRQARAATGGTGAAGQPA